MQDYKTMIAMCEEQEEKFQFTHFSREDALKIGLKLHENAKEQPVAVEITVNGLVVFRYFAEGAKPDSELWLARKRNAVELTESSSLRMFAEMEAAGQEVQRDPFGHVKLDTINPGQWFAKQFAELIGAEKVMVQKSGYYSRAAHANAEDLALIKKMCDLAVDCALRGESGVIGQDEENNDELTAIAFPRIAGAKPFDITQAWFTDLMAELGQKVEPAEAAPEH